MSLIEKNLPVNPEDIRDAGSIPGLGRSPGLGNGTPLQYSCLVNSMGRVAWWATVHRVAKHWTWLNDCVQQQSSSQGCNLSLFICLLWCTFRFGGVWGLAFKKWVTPASLLKFCTVSYKYSSNCGKWRHNYRGSELEWTVTVAHFEGDFVIKLEKNQQSGPLMKILQIINKEMKVHGRQTTWNKALLSKGSVKLWKEYRTQAGTPAHILTFFIMNKF